VIPWVIWTVLVGAINLTLFVAIRGRWGREAMGLVLAALAGTAAGDSLAGLVGFDLLRLGEFHLAGAVIGAQLALVTIAALSTILAPPRTSDRRRDGVRPGR
jgi:drug/metabolite transporter superfamily protein YnfA